MAMIVRAAEGVPGVPDGFPILFDDDMAIIEAAFAYLIEHATVLGRSHAAETVRTYAEHLHDWFDSLEQSGIDWRTADEMTVAAYRNRMLEAPSSHTRRPYARSTINDRVRTVCRFYEWAHRRGLVEELPFRFVDVRSTGNRRERGMLAHLDRQPPTKMTANALTVAQRERLPRPLRVEELRRLTLRSAIRRFRQRVNARIEAWNAAHADRPPRSPLPDFAPVFFRGSVATEHYKASGGDILVAQAVLNHADPVTTETYIKGPETRRLQHETIARLQTLMLAWITGSKTATSEHAAGPAGAPATVLFSHDCRNPVLAAAASPTRLCPHYGGCFACPGLVIPVDSEHLARVLQAKRHLEAARARLDRARWELLYAPSHRILVNDVLPDFPDELYPVAQRLISDLPPLPDLE